MKNTFRLFVALFTLIISSTLCFAGSKTLTLTAGNLSSQITEEEKTNTTTIILSGEIDQRDIIFMRDEMSSLTSIDIKNCKIMSHSVFEENVLPEYSFFTGVSETTEDKKLVKIIIPESCTKIGAYAFKECWSLEEVALPHGLTVIDKGAFANCGALKEVDFPSTVSNINEYAFFGCSSLNNVVLPSLITSVEAYTFFGCESLNKISLPTGLSVINNYAFANATKLKALELPSGLKSIGNYTFSGAVLLEDINFPQGLESIGKFAFEKCSSLTEITINSVSLLPDEGLFSNCSSLKSITLPATLYSIPDYMFFGCTSLQSFVVNERVTDIGNGVFGGCTHLREVILPENLNSIGDFAFTGCSNLKNISIPQKVSSIGEGAFSMCLTFDNITLPSGLKKIEDNLFALCSNLEVISIPSSVTSIGKQAFSDCYQLKSVALPNNVTTIDESAFENCNSLIGITIPSSVNRLANLSFYQSGLSDYIVSNIKEPKAINNDVFDSNIYNNVVLRVPFGTAGAYRSLTGWKNFASITENILTSEYVTLKVFHNDGGDVIINGIKVDSDTETEIDNAINNILSITANDGYFVTNAMIGETAIENFENFIIPAEINNTILTAEFSKYSYSVRIIETGASTFSEFIFEHGEQPKIRINSSDNGEIESVKLNGVNITEEVTGNNYLQLTPIRENTTLVINPTKVNVDVNEMTASGINYWSVSNSLFIESEKKMASLESYDTSGRKVLSDSNNGYSFVAKLPSSQVYLATVMFDDNSTETIKVNIAN